MIHKHVILFLEGETDKEVYKRIIEEIKKVAQCKQFPVDNIDFINLKGIGQYAKNAARSFSRKKMLYKDKAKGEHQYEVFLCYDTDVFEHATKPPVNWMAIEKDLKGLGANRIYHVKVRQSIEDWVLSEEKGIKKYFGVKGKLPSKGSGYETLNYLFRTYKQMPYYKGSSISVLLEKLDTRVILRKHCQALQALCNALGVRCYKDGRCELL